MVYILYLILSVIAVVFLYFLYYWITMCYYLKFLTIGELSKFNWELSNKYDALSKKERFYFGWIYTKMMNKIETKIQDLIKKM